MNGENMMRKKNKVFLIVAIVLVGLMVSACERSAISGNNGGTQNDSDDQLTSILTVVASQQPVGEVTPEGFGGGADEDDGDAEQTLTPEGLSVLPPTATPLPPTATPTPEPVEMVVPNTYTLRKGEFPFCLARRFNVDVDSLLAANNLARGATYPEGLTLTIPKSAPDFQGDRMLLTHPVTYTVLPEDTFYNIACRYGDVYPEEIAANNGMSVNDTLQVGTQLSIP